MNRIILIVSPIASLFLMGCAHDAPPPVFVARSCVPDGFPGPPAYADTDEAMAAAPGAPQRLQLVVTANEQRKARQAVTEPVIQGCR